MGKLIKATVLTGILLAIAIYIMVTTFAPGDSPEEQAENARKFTEDEVGKAAKIIGKFVQPAPENEGTGLREKVKSLDPSKAPAEVAPPREVEGVVEKPEEKKPEKKAPPAAAPTPPGTEPAEVEPVPAPEPEKIIHTVLKGETLSTIAEQYLGDSDLWPLIVKANPGINADRISVGQKLIIPSLVADAKVPGPTIPTAPAKPSVEEQGWEWYTVRDGDTLYGIAKRVLGDAKRIGEIEALNPELTDLGSIYPGQKIRIPKSSGRK
ncbi:MAG: LysM peptidoglycan-binding domain-containing protein [Planctomycetota bacterium]|jgi:nucleoid-associated protein YgaU